MHVLRSSFTDMGSFPIDKHGKRDAAAHDPAVTLNGENTALHDEDILELGGVNPVNDAKMRLVNNAIEEIGFTPYQAKLFVLNGFG